MNSNGNHCAIVVSNDDEKSYIILGEHYGEIDGIVRISKWICICISFCVCVIIVIIMVLK